MPDRLKLLRVLLGLQGRPMDDELSTGNCKLRIIVRVGVLNELFLAAICNWLGLRHADRLLTRKPADTSLRVPPFAVSATQIIAEAD